MAEQGNLELDEVLEQVLFYCLDEARDGLREGGGFDPFSVVVDGDQMYVESYEVNDVEACHNNARATIRAASTFATHYAFCYDGFLNTNQGTLDAIIVECAQRDMEESYTIGLLYEKKPGGVEFQEQPALVMMGETFFDREGVRYAEEHEPDQSAGI